jgi:hypothetical protein
MSEFFAPTLDEQIACVERELRLRRQVYPRWVATGRKKQAVADREIQVMEAVLTTLRALQSSRNGHAKQGDHSPC